MENNKVKVIKISAEALFEFVYEKFIEEQECYMDVNPTEVTNAFDIDWENGQFIFCAYNSEDSQGNILKLPEKVNMQKLMNAIPDTTKSMFTDERYREYTKEELVELSKE